MAIATLSLLTPSPSTTVQPNPSLHLKFPLSLNSSVFFHRKLTRTNAKVFVRKAVEESAESEVVKEAGATGVVSELGAEIKKAMVEREKEEKKGGDLLSGVAEEIQEIEWPAFGKVLGTTGVVLGVIAGSSVVLLTVNAILAELSDRVFAGRGVQDFFR